MARTKSGKWTAIISGLVGMLIASIFWRYSPYGPDQLARQAPEDLQTQAAPLEMKGGPVSLKKMASQATGQGYQLMTDGKQVFLADLKNGRVWRYFRLTKEEGGREDEGFLPIALYYAGQKHFAASEIEPPPGTPGSPSQAAPAGTQPR
jgi:hypothetical protein